jgi:radical SAM protein with 4Fe4S-binding SPASM domain
MDGITQESYERYRQKGKLESVLDGIRTIVEQKRVLNSKTPFINLRFIVMKQNEHEIPRLKELSKSLKVDALTFKTLNPHSNFTYMEKTSKKDEGNELLPENNLYRRFKYTQDGHTRIRLKQNPCKSLWNSPVIHWNGIVCPCTYDYNEKYILGDLKENTFKNIWFETPYRRMRNQFRKDWGKINFCNECSFAYAGGDCSRESVAEAIFFNPNDQI